MSKSPSPLALQVLLFSVCVLVVGGCTPHMPLSQRTEYGVARKTKFYNIRAQEGFNPIVVSLRAEGWDIVDTDEGDSLHAVHSEHSLYSRATCSIKWKSVSEDSSRLDLWMRVPLHLFSEDERIQALIDRIDSKLKEIESKVANKNDEVSS